MKICKPWSNSEIQTLRNNWAAKRPEDIARLIGRTDRAVSHKAKILQLKKSPDYSGRRTFHPKFSFWRSWSPELAYILGFIAADGNVYEGHSKHLLQMSLQRRDGYMLHRMALFGGGRTSDIPKKKAIGWTVAGVSFIETIKELGIHPRKSHRLTLPFVPRDLQSHFVRGYCDGDGCLGIHPVARGTVVMMSICGNAAMLSGLRELIYSHVQIVGKTNIAKLKGRNVYELRFTTREDLLRLLPWMYDGATLWLSRKKEIADDIIDNAKHSMLQMARRR